MRTWGIRTIGLLALIGFVSGAAKFGIVAQEAPPQNRAVAEVRNANVRGGVLRQIRDPHTGLTWVIQRDAKNPAGPGRMAATTEGSGEDSKPIVIRRGDRVVLEETTPAVNARLESSALECAAPGSHFAVRLKIGGKVISAVALGPGRAALVSSWGDQP
jgi:hypothetical protein